MTLGSPLSLHLSLSAECGPSFHKVDELLPSVSKLGIRKSIGVKLAQEEGLPPAQSQNGTVRGEVGFQHLGQ